MNRSALATFSLATAIAVMTLGYANPSYAAKPCIDDDTHPSCKTDDDDGAAFDVDITGDLGLDGGSGEDPWVQGVLGKNGIGLKDVAPDDLAVGTLTGVGGFFLDEKYAPCFDFDDTGHDFSPELHQAYIKPGKKGRAEAKFWFHGETYKPLDGEFCDGESDGESSCGPASTQVRVLYVLTLFGEFDPIKVWPGPQTLEMDAWELKVENEGKTIKEISCQSEGDKVVVTIKVTAL